MAVLDFPISTRRNHPQETGSVFFPTLLQAWVPWRLGPSSRKKKGVGGMEEEAPLRRPLEKKPAREQGLSLHKAPRSLLSACPPWDGPERNHILCSQWPFQTRSWEWRRSEEGARQEGTPSWKSTCRQTGRFTAGLSTNSSTAQPWQTWVAPAHRERPLWQVPIPNRLPEEPTLNQMPIPIQDF